LKSAAEFDVRKSAVVLCPTQISRLHCRGVGDDDELRISGNLIAVSDAASPEI
jgi:hypothetical protein